MSVSVKLLSLSLTAEQADSALNLNLTAPVHQLFCSSMWMSHLISEWDQNSSKNNNSSERHIWALGSTSLDLARIYEPSPSS